MSRKLMIQHLVSRGILAGFLLLFVGTSIPALAQQRTPEPVRMLENKSFDDSPEMRQKILDAYENLRVPDVVDALDLIGLQDVTLFDRKIRPLWQESRSLLF